MVKAGKHSVRSWGCELFYYAANFAVAIVLFVALLALAQVYPFGEESFLTEDLKYQYFDFFTWFKRVLGGQATLFYSFGQALGANTWGLFSYYLASPFNLLIWFFDYEHITDFLVLVTALKFGCIQLSQVFYLRKRFRLSHVQAMVLALCFSFGLWTVVQACNPMWMDALYLMPLMMLGAWRFVREGRWLLVLVSTALNVMMCWYMAYMCILFMCLFILFEAYNLHVQKPGLSKRYFAKRALGFAGVVVLALLLSAWTFVPTVLAMLGGSEGLGIQGVAFYGPDEVLANFFIGVWHINKWPEFFTSSFVLVLVAAFFCMRRIPLRVRLVALAFLLLMIAGSWFTAVEYVWCGFRTPHGFFSRVCFMTAFLLVWLAAAALKSISEMGLRWQAPAAICVVLCAAIGVVMWLGHFQQFEYGFAALGTTCISCVLVAALGMRKQDAKGILAVAANVVALVLVAGEVLFSGMLAWQQVYVGFTQEENDAYVVQAREQAAAMKALDGGAYRFDKTITRCELAALNQGLAYGYNQLSIYSSAENISAVNFLSELGYSNPGEISVTYDYPLLLLDSLLGVKYAACEEQPALYEETGIADDRLAVYKNPYALSLGYGVDGAVRSAAVVSSEDSVFEKNNSLVSAMLGEEVQCYKPAKAVVKDSDSRSVTWTVTVPANSIGYAYIVSDHDKGTWLGIDGPRHEDNMRFRHCITPLADVANVDEEHNVTITALDDKAGNPGKIKGTTCDFFYLDLDVFNQVIARLASHQLQVSEFCDGHIAGSYEADEDGLMLLTVPFDSGWNVLVNGQKANVSSAFDGAMMVVPVSMGANQIQMDYTPPGLLLGALLSVVALLLVLVLLARRMESARYLLVGGSTALLELLLFQGLYQLTPAGVVVANVCAVVVATGLNFLLNRNFTFRSSANPRRSMVRYLLLFAFNTVFTTAAIALLVGAGVPSVAAKLATMCCVVVWNFFLYRKFVFA